MRRVLKSAIYIFAAIIVVGIGTELLVRWDAQHKEKVASIYESYEKEQKNRQVKKEDNLNILEETIPLSAPSSEGQTDEGHMDSTAQPESDVLNENLKIVWLGTAIPAFGNEAIEAYPLVVGQALDVQVFNESIGNSCVRAGSANHVTTEDPMGYSGMNWDVLLRSLSLSSDEKGLLMDQWQEWRHRLEGSPPWKLSEEDREFYKSTSWDQVLADYLGEDNRADIYVFDHGHNDVIMNQWDNTVELGRIPQVRGDRTYYIGAMEFLIDKILEDHPEARIYMVGHYENDRKVSVAESQTILANHLEIPLEKTWEVTGWTQESIEVMGLWQDGYWVESETNHRMTITEKWMPDDLIPYSDESGKAIEYLANIHADFISNQLD